MSIELYIQAALMYDPATLTDNDKNVAGVYSVSTDDTVTPEQYIGAAMDGLHSWVDIDDPGAFEYTVLTATGDRVLGERTCEDYALESVVQNVYKLHKEEADQIIAKAHASANASSTEPEGLWGNNELQFTRLLSEINAAVAFTDDQWAELSANMDLSREDIEQIFDRAGACYENAKEAL